MKLNNLTLLLPGLSFIATTSQTPTPPPATYTTNTTTATPCDCYIISGPDPGYFTNYHFWDFRNIPLPNNPSKPNTLPLTQTAFATDWLPQTWTKTGTPSLSLLPITNAASNVYITTNPDPTRPTKHQTFLLLQTTRLDSTVSTAEIECQTHNILHSSLRVRMRIMSKETALGSPQAKPEARHNKTRPKGLSPPKPTPKHPVSTNRVPKGACIGLFTYASKTCESDIEILTSDHPHTIHYSNQPDYDPVTDTVIPGAGSEVNLSVPWTAWTTHRLDWLPGWSRWYADGRLAVAKTYGVPDRA
ncbi:hypothetical protein BBP40_010801, partial [Aspergillus hancockii]